MNGEILTEGEMQQAMRLAQELELVVTSLEELSLSVHAEPVKKSADFLASLAWKGMQR